MILVTGGTGLVGSHLLYDLVLKGKKVRALKRKNSNTELVRTVFGYYCENPDKLFNAIEWQDGDILDSFSLKNAMKDIEDVYHCAALVSFREQDHKNMRDVNVVGTANLVNICLETKIRKFCMVSSIAALGTPQDNMGIVTETTPWNPKDKRSVYSTSKFKSELEVWRGIEEGLTAVIVNPSVIIGPGQWNKGSSLLFNTVAKGIKYYTDGIIGYVDVRDVSRSMVELMESKIENERFIINGEDCTYEFVFKTIARYLGVVGPTKYAARWMTELAWRLSYLQKIFLFTQPALTKETARAAHDISYYSNQKIKEKLGFEFTSIEKSIKDTAKHYPKTPSKTPQH